MDSSLVEKPASSVCLLDISLNTCARNSSRPFVVVSFDYDVVQVAVVKDLLVVVKACLDAFLLLVGTMKLLTILIRSVLAIINAISILPLPRRDAVSTLHQQNGQ